MIKQKLLLFICISCIFNNALWAASISSDKKPTFYRGYLAAGPRIINGQVMSDTEYDIGMELGLGAYRNCQKNNCYYGLQVFANNSWDSRFNSVNDSSDTTTPTTQLHNSSSLDLLAFNGKRWGEWSGELGAGAQLAWVKWVGSPQQAEDRLRIVPKLRAMLNYNIKNNTNLFVALNQTINTYGDLSCSSGTPNCVNDEGYVGVTDIKLGVSMTLN